MKTQLLEDFDESGSAAAHAAAPAAGQDAPARQAAPARAAVWHRPQASNTPGQRSSPPGPAAQHAGAGAMGAMGGTTGAAPQASAAAGQMRPPGGQAMQGGAASSTAQGRQRASEGAWSGPRPLPPDADTGTATEAATDGIAAAGARARAQEGAPTGAHMGAHTGPAVPPPGPAPAADIPDWLAERLRQDAEQETQRQRSRLVTRRALGWSGAATLAAMLAVAGYWFYQESRVDGALDVVAGTAPGAPTNAVLGRKPPALPGTLPATAPAPSAAQAAIAEPPVPAVTAPADAQRSAPASQDASGAAPAPAAVASAAPPETPVLAAPGLAGEAAHVARTHKRVRTAEAKAATALDNIDGPLQRSGAPAHRRHKVADTRVRTAAAPAAVDGADSEPTPGQRREETLMQCRVLGYDERECTRRGCAMTRFGLVCPG